MTSESEETRTIAGRDVTYFNPGNVAFYRHVLDEMDGFDEYLEVGGAKDLAHRIAGAGYEVSWQPSMAVRSEYEADGGVREPEWNWKYRSLTYRLVKNYGPRLSVARRVLGRAGRDAVDGLRDVAGGDTDPSEWLGIGRQVLGGTATGLKDGIVARSHDRSTRRNPRGGSMRTDRAVQVYDFR